MQNSHSQMSAGRTPRKFHFPFSQLKGWTCDKKPSSQVTARIKFSPLAGCIALSFPWGIMGGSPHVVFATAGTTSRKIVGDKCRRYNVSQCVHNWWSFKVFLRNKQEKTHNGQGNSFQIVLLYKNVTYKWKRLINKWLFLPKLWTAWGMDCTISHANVQIWQSY